MTARIPSDTLSPARPTGFLALVAGLALAAGCGGGSGTPDSGADPGRDLPVLQDAGIDPGADLPGSADLGTDASPDPASGDAWEVPEGLPDGLPFAFTRTPDGDLIPEGETRDFTMRLLAFLDEIRYFDHVLYTTHGVDESSGHPGWQFWYNERFRKDGDLVTFYHPPNPTDGGHNLHIPMSRVLGDAVAAWLVTGDGITALAAERLCRGMTASMLGMVHDDRDPLPHLMSRNVVPAYAQEFRTHDGKRKAVDPSGWFSDYTRWNCERFQYADNPHYGPTWVTSQRSKDDVPHVFRLVPVLRYAADRAPPGSAREACAETLRMLEAFTKDIVDHDFHIRTKDAQGNPYEPGYTGDAERDAKWGDISTFTWWRDVIPEGECNARRASELIAYHRPLQENCGRGEPNLYDEISFVANGYNKRIARFFHVAHLANALVNRDMAGAALLLDGLDERFAVDLELGRTQTHYTKGRWDQDFALFRVQSEAFGMPLTWTEARDIQARFRRSIDELSSWPYWDPWAPSVPDGDLGSYRPPSCRGEGDAQECWFGVEDLAQVFETCWSPFRNPSGAVWVDCDLVRTWDGER
ncbi:hypothetical protein KBD49_02060 [Myxococcota bacterium]|nr:hypothetical protein [Myxococcota bacterium]